MTPHKALIPTEQQALKHFKTVLHSLLGENLLSLRLFGSRARGEGTEESDLDVLVVLREKNRSLCRRVVAEALEIDLAYDTNLAPTILSEKEYEENCEYQTPFYRNVERESVPL
jgi:predicted nucleotidyltransferase